MSQPIIQTMQGALVMGTFVVALFFFRYWRITGDRLFMMFAFAFWALGINWLGLALLATTDEARTAFYLVRLLAFVLILAAIVDKNRGASAIGRAAGCRLSRDVSLTRPRFAHTRRMMRHSATPRVPPSATTCLQARSSSGRP
jgi:hypothetical protein